MNMTNINLQLLTIEAAHTKKLQHIYQAAMLDPHTASELGTDDIKAMVDKLVSARGDHFPKHKQIPKYSYTFARKIHCNI